MLRRVGLVRTDVSEELSACIIRVTRIGELGTTLAVTSNRRQLLVRANVDPSSQILVTLMMQALSSSETSVLTRATRRNIPEGTILQESPPMYSKMLRGNALSLWKFTALVKEQTNKQIPWLLARKWTIPADGRSSSAKLVSIFSGRRVSRGRCSGYLWQLISVFYTGVAIFLFN
jgi:hypothetical protein